MIAIYNRALGAMNHVFYGANKLQLNAADCTTKKVCKVAAAALFVVAPGAAFYMGKLSRAYTAAIYAAPVALKVASKALSWIGNHLPSCASHAPATKPAERTEAPQS